MKILTKQWYKKMQKAFLSQEERNEITSAMDKANHETIEFPYYLHDGILIDFRNDGMNIDLIIYVDYEVSSFETRFIRITFVNAKIIELEEGITFVKDKTLIQFIDEKRRDKLDSFAIYLYDELYKLDKNYEFHCMIEEVNDTSDRNFKYITILCEDINVEKSYKY